MKYTYLVISLLLTGFCSSAQTFLTGKVHKKESTELLVSVSIENHTQRKYDLSDESGSYRIPAKEGDLLIFSSAGYRTDSIVVSAAMLSGDFPVTLAAKVVALQSVRIGSLTNYQSDSIARREIYKWVYDHGNEKLVERERKNDGVGVNIALFRNGSRADKQRETLKQRLIREEEQHYIDFRYSKEYVSRLTHLKGDSLDKFMQEYRPTYEYARSASNVDILVFVSDGIKKFRAPQGNPNESAGSNAPDSSKTGGASDTPESR